MSSYRCYGNYGAQKKTVNKYNLRSGPGSHGVTIWNNALRLFIEQIGNGLSTFYLSILAIFLNHFSTEWDFVLVRMEQSCA